MNPLTNMKNVIKLSEQELLGKNKTSWHDQYRDSAWIFVGGLPYDLTEGDIICIFSQYGEIVNINLKRDKDSGNSKGFCFLCYEDQRSTDLAVDNFNGISILKRKIRVDHVREYKVPKTGKKTNEETKKLYEEGCAPKLQPVQAPINVQRKSEFFDYRETLADQIRPEIKLPQRLPIYPIKQECDEKLKRKNEKKHKKRNRKRSSDTESSSDSTDETSEDSSREQNEVKRSNRNKRKDKRRENKEMENDMDVSRKSSKRQSLGRKEERTKRKVKKRDQSPN